jgi:hypothetical protein
MIFPIDRYVTRYGPRRNPLAAEQHGCHPVRQPDDDIFRAGVNLKFDWGGPIVER